MTAVSHPALVAELERRCLRGLAAAAGALAGDEASAVCATFAAWRSAARRPWPWLPGLCFGALEPLGVSFPDDDEAAIVLGRMLIGAESDAGAAERALAALADDAGDPTGELAIDATGSLRRRSLLVAVDRFWEDLAAAMRRVHAPVVRGDRDGADWIIVAARRQLEDERERLRELTRRVGEDLAAAASSASAGFSVPSPLPEPHLAPEDAEEGWGPVLPPESAAPAPEVAEEPEQEPAAGAPAPEGDPASDWRSAWEPDEAAEPEDAAQAEEAGTPPETDTDRLPDLVENPNPYAELAELDAWRDAEPDAEPGAEPDARLDETQLLASGAPLDDPDATGPILDDDMEATGPLDALHPPPPEQVPPAAAPGPGPVPSGPPSRPRTSAAPRHQGPPSAGPSRQPPRPEDIEYRKVREHAYAPIVFVVVLVLVALVVVFTVGTAPG